MWACELCERIPQNPAPPLSRTAWAGQAAVNVSQETRTRTTYGTNKRGEGNEEKYGCLIRSLPCGHFRGQKTLEMVITCCRLGK